LRLAFLGSPEFALPSLDALAAAGHEIAAVYCQPPRPVGRGGKTQPSPVHARALERGWPVATPRSLKKDPQAQADFAALGLDIAVVVAYGLILPAATLAAPRLGCLNVHASLLPRWRGAAPIERAIMAGDAETGVCIMRMEEGLDTGPVLLREAVSIPRDATGAGLRADLAARGARLIVDALDRMARGPLPETPQPAIGVTYAAKLTPADERIDWRRPAIEIERQVRALSPRPGAWFEVAGERMKLLGATVVEGSGASGTVLDDRLTVACGGGALRPTLLQRAGRAAMPADALLRGFKVVRGTVLPAS
jgi:methionyl-tRNA formyltransferase